MAWEAAWGGVRAGGGRGAGAGRRRRRVDRHLVRCTRSGVQPGLGPGVTVEVLVGERPGVRLALPDLGDSYDATMLPGRHPLVEQTIASLIETVDDPPGLDVSVRSAVPPGRRSGRRLRWSLPSSPASRWRSDGTSCG